MSAPMNRMASKRMRSKPIVGYTDHRYWTGMPKRFCQACVRRARFWCLVAALALFEPVLCARAQTPFNLFLQYLALAVSTGLYFIQIVGVATTEWDKIQAIQALGGLGSIFVRKGDTTNQFTVVKLVTFFTAEGEFLLEGIMLFAGWALIGWHPGLAILRCFRVFRILWFYEIPVFKSGAMKSLGPIVGEGFVKRVFKVLKFAIKALTALGNEIFRLTEDTRGGLLLIMLIFFSSWVLGATIYVETQGQLDNCTSIGLCTWTFIRLSMVDGNGLDLMYQLSAKHRFLFFICMIFMCITSFGIVNGLVGIFGNLFNDASVQAFEMDDADEGRYGKEASDESSSSSSEESEPDVDEAAVYEKNNKPFATNGEDGGKGSQEPDEETGKVIPLRKFSKDQQLSATNLLKSVQGEAPPLSPREMKGALRDILGTKEVPRFALQEFQVQQTENSPRPPDSRSGSRPPTASKRGHKTIPLEGHHCEEDDHIRAETKHKPGGLFSHNTKARPPSGHQHHHQHQHHHHDDLTMQQVAGQLQYMQQRIEQQNELIVSMYNHLSNLTKKVASRPASAMRSNQPQQKTVSIAEVVDYDV